LDSLVCFALICLERGIFKKLKHVGQLANPMKALFSKRAGDSVVKGLRGFLLTSAFFTIYAFYMEGGGLAFFSVIAASIFSNVSATESSSLFVKRFLRVSLYNTSLLASEAFVLVNQRNQHFVPKAETATLQMLRRLKDKICLGSL
jgi:hypothetical protein